MIELKGIAWDHPRGIEPLVASSEAFSKLYPYVSIKWDVRSLKEFGDMPIEDLINQYDFITIDHPYMGQADKNQLLLPLEEYISNDVLNELSTQSVGSSFKSYYYNNHLYALPVDAAALVAAYRKDIITKLGLNLPKTIKDIKDFYKKIPTGFSIAWALCPTDFWCVFLTLCAQHAGRDFIQGFYIDKKTGVNALDEIKRNLKYIHPKSMHWNPIQILDEMSSNDEIIYSPYIFGYSNYSREGYSKNIVHFTDSPINPLNDVSTILGGVGLAISKHCQDVKAAVEFVAFVASSKNQEGIYTLNSGQPGNLNAWKSENNNKMCNDFFNNTLKTLKKAYVRPQHPAWNLFQEQGACLLHQGVLEDMQSDKLIKNLNQLYQSVICYE